MVYTLLSGPMVYTLFPCFPRKMAYTVVFFCSVASGSGDRPRKEGCHSGGVYPFFPCSGRQTRVSSVFFFVLRGGGPNPSLASGHGCFSQIGFTRRGSYSAKGRVSAF